MQSATELHYIFSFLFLLSRRCLLHISNWRSFIFVRCICCHVRLLLFIKCHFTNRGANKSSNWKIKWRGMCNGIALDSESQPPSNAPTRTAYRLTVYEYKITRDYNIIMKIIIAILLSNFSLIKCGPFVNTYAVAWAIDRMVLAAFGICSFLILFSVLRFVVFFFRLQRCVSQLIERFFICAIQTLFLSFCSFNLFFSFLSLFI